jgi:hypothetical protein
MRHAESSYEVPPPILFNTWKHHAAAIRHRIGSLVEGEASSLNVLSRELLVIGSELMDLYMGALLPAEIARGIIAILERQSRLEISSYRAWIAGGKGYRVETLAEDGSEWVLRMGDEAGRYVHIHPARWAPLTRRVRANVLKTAIMVSAYVQVSGGDPNDIQLINAVRAQYLEMSPMGKLSMDEGLGLLLDALRNRAAQGLV